MLIINKNIFSLTFKAFDSVEETNEIITLIIVVLVQRMNDIMRSKMNESNFSLVVKNDNYLEKKFSLITCAYLPHCVNCTTVTLY